MRRVFRAFISIFVCLVVFFTVSGCKQTTDDSTTTTSSGTTETTTTASSSSTWSYLSSSPMYEVSSSVSSLTISGLTSGQKIYLAKTNTSSSTAIGTSYSRYVKSGSGITLSTAESSSGTPSGGPGGGGGPGAAVTDFIAPVNLAPSNFTKMSTAARSALTLSKSVTQPTLTVDSTTKDIYVDQDEDISTFAQEETTLRASGTYCNVWVVSSCYTSGSASGEQIDSSLAKTLAEKFDAIYPMVRNIFGDESENLYAYNSGSVSEVAMSGYDDTGTYTVDGTSYRKVNIVVYDIGSDYSASDISSTGIVGYFYAKDYYYNTGDTLSENNGYKVIDYSNAGKYFYIDAAYAVEYTDTVYSTLAHEFQHMINFGVKEMDKGLDPSTWYNEMMSMLSEDMMRSYLDLAYDDAPEGRLPFFERCYKDLGLENYTNVSRESYYQLLMYANSYAFGAWVLRQFGGVPVLAAMSSNAYVDMPSIIQAIKTVTGTEYTVEALLKMYAEACIFSDASLGMPTFDQKQELSSGDTYYYTDSTYGYLLSALDLWNLDDIFTDDFTSSYSNTSYYKYDGPELYGYNASYIIRPYGITLVDVGTATTDTATLTFSTNGYSTEHLYLMVQ